MRIAVDLDGVLADTMVTFCAILNKRHSTRFTVDSFIQWNAWDIAQITKREFFQTLNEAWFDWENIPPVEENIGEKVRRIHKLGRMDIVTGRSLETVQSAKAWLEKMQVDYDEFVRTASTNEKAFLSYDVFIDDAPDLMATISSSVTAYGILYTQPWNRNAPGMTRIFKVSRWDQIPKLLDQIPLKE